MSRFIQLHLLTAFPPANLNRDDMGSPKTAKMGGYDRLRVSSQCLKRTWRTSEQFQQALAGHIGTRTKEMGVKIYDYLREKGIDHKRALDWTKKIAGVFGKLKKLSKNELKDKSEEEKIKKELEEVKIEQLAFISSEEEKAVFSLLDKMIANNAAPENDDLDLLRQTVSDVDIALFGRMLALKPAKPEFNIEAACQVAHAISVHPVVIEDDYFTAVDDLNDGREDMGAAHIGETRFAAALFYVYICINKAMLIDNLGGDEALANRAIRALTEAAVKVSPEGKQNSFASRAYASYVLAEKGDQQPRTLSVAYLKPIMDRESEDFESDAIERLKMQNQRFDTVYGDCADHRYELNVPEMQGSLQELLDFVAN